MTVGTPIRLALLRQPRAAALGQLCACLDSATFRRPIRRAEPLQTCPSLRACTLDPRSLASIRTPATVSATLPLRYKPHGVAASSN